MRRSLGYIVDAFVVPHLDVVELKVVVQGQTAPDVVAERIDKELRANVDAVAATAVASYVHAVRHLFERFDVEFFSDFSAK